MVTFKKLPSFLGKKNPLAYQGLSSSSSPNLRDEEEEDRRPDVHNFDDDPNFVEVVISPIRSPSKRVSNRREEGLKYEGFSTPNSGDMNGSSFDNPSIAAAAAAAASGAGDGALIQDEATNHNPRSVFEVSVKLY